MLKGKVETSRIDLSSYSTGELLKSLSENGMKRSALLEDIDKLNAPVETKYALIVAANSESGRAHSENMVRALGGDLFHSARAATVCELLDNLPWRELDTSGDRAPVRNPPTKKVSDPPASWVYFIEAKASGLVKIGYSIDPYKRLKEITAMSPDELRLIAKFRGSLKDEAALHKQFAHLRKHGEWFEMNHEVTDLLETSENIVRL